jgi:hypothetical protein
MANKTYPTLLDIAIRNGRDRAIPLIEETSYAMPEISGLDQFGKKIPGVGAARTINGLHYETLVRVTNPVVGFRNANQPAKVVASQYTNRLTSTYILNPRWQCDKAVADGSEDGPDAYIADEAIAIMEASMQWLGKQFYYGRGATAGGVGQGNDPKGFPGLIDAVKYQYSAGGTPGGGATNGPDGVPMCTSVFFVKFGPTDVQWVYGANGLLQIPDKRVETIYIPDPDNGGALGPVDGYVQSLLARPGVQIGSTRSIFRIPFITAETGHTLTDNMLYTAQSMMLKQPDVCFMHPYALNQLRASRTTFNPSGMPAPVPTETNGIPIIPTRSISLTETA